MIINLQNKTNQSRIDKVKLTQINDVSPVLKQNKVKNDESLVIE